MSVELKNQLIIVYPENGELKINADAFDTPIQDIEYTTLKRKGYGESPSAILNFEKPPKKIGKDAAMFIDSNGKQALLRVELPETVSWFSAESFWVSELECSLYDSDNNIIIDKTLIRKRGNWDDKEINIPEGIETIDNNICWEGYTKSNIKKVSLPTTLVRIGDANFEDFEALTSIKLPKKLEYIGKDAFSNCLLSTLTIPEGVKTIDDRAFKNNSKLKKIKIGKSVDKIGEEVFAYTPKLETIEGKFASADKKLLIINGALNTVAIGVSKDFKIPEEVSNISPMAFTRQIWYRAKWDRYCFDSIHINSRIKVLEESAFAGCQIEDLKIPETIETIKPGFLKNCRVKNLDGKYVEFPFIIDKDILLGMASINPSTPTEIPEKITIIGKFAMPPRGGCYNNGLNLPNNLKKIEEGAFESADDIHISALPESLEVLEDCAFGGVTESIFPNNKVVIPKSIKYMGKRSICGVMELEVWFEGFVPPVFAEYETFSHVIINVPKGSKRDYEKALPHLKGILKEY